MRSFMFVCFVFIGLGGIVSVCYAISKPSGRSGTITLVFSGGELGYLEPCGCSEGQLGGIARRDSFLQELRAHGNIIVPIANGNLIQDALPQSEIKADIGFLALADMGYVAYNVGARDLQLGTARLMALSEQNRLPLISANLYQGTSPAFTPYFLHTRRLSDDVVKIAIVGLISPSYAVYAENTDLVIREPNTVLKALRTELTKNADLIVCLFNGIEVEASKLRNNFPMLDVTVVSNDNTEKGPLSALPDRQFVNTKTKGKSIWSVKVHWDPTRHLALKSPRRHLLDEQIPDSQRMIELLALYQQMITDENFAESEPRTQQKTGPQFVGTTTCKTCHSAEWTSWKATKHAHAYHTLEVAGHETDPDCLTCHTVGFGFSTGFLSVEETPSHLDVGCENCHGAGSIHVKQQNAVSNTTDAGYGKGTETMCLVCHTLENSPKFDLKVYFPKILHTLEEHR